MTATDHHPNPPDVAGAPAAPAPDGDAMTTAQWLRVAALGALLVVLVATAGIWGVVVVFGLILSIVLHELGHYVAAKRAGMKVTEFFVGFGPRIWSIRRGETEYGLKLIPAGAYVRIIGMSNLEEVAPEDEARAYRQGRFRDRVMVVTAGPLMNFATAIVLIWIVLSFVGAPGGSFTKKADGTKWKIDRIYKGTGAYEAGLRAGDKITAVNGERVVDFEDLKPLIQPNEGKTLQITYVRNGVAKTVPVELHSYIAEDGEAACCLGVRQFLLDWETKTVNPVVAVPRSFAEFGAIGAKTLSSIGSFFSPSGLKSFGSQVVNAQNDRDAASSSATTQPVPSTPSAGSSGSADDTPGQNRLTSVVGIFQIGTSAGNSAGLSALLVLFIVVNIALGVFNLVPLLPFDGGHAAVAVYEKVQEKRHHLAGRYFTDVSRLLPATYVVVMIIAALGLTSIYLDIVNPLKVD